MEPEDGPPPPAPAPGRVHADDVYFDALKRGADLYPVPDAGMIAHVERLRFEAMRPPGLEADIDRWVERLRNDPEARLRSELAHRAGISYSAAVQRWEDPQDLAAEYARVMLDVDDRIERCGACGTRPDEVLDFTDPDRPRPLDEPLWKLYRFDCWTCIGLADLNGELTPEERTQGARWEVRPRGDGEPWIDG